MNERKKRTVLPNGEIVEGTVVDVVSSTEKFSDFTLSDGTILKVKLTVLEAVRQDGQWDMDGNPIYQLKCQQIVLSSEVPNKLMRNVKPNDHHHH